MSTDSGRREGGHDGAFASLASVALALVVVTAVLAAIPGTATAQENRTFIVEQGGNCVEVTPVGNGSQSGAAYYDYRVLNDTANYSSFGTRDIQEDQTSQLFVHDGSDGLSLVFLHDRINAPGGFAATADLSGLPSDGRWAVEDDNYTNRDDVFNYTDTGAHIEWVSNGERTDGAVFTGLGSSDYSTITADVKFNERSNRYPFEEWDGSPDQNRIERWVVRSGTGQTTELDMSQPVEISPGTCSGGVSTFTATPSGSNTTGTGTGTTDAATTSPTDTPTAGETSTPTEEAAETTTAAPAAETTSVAGDAESGTGTGTEAGTTGGGGDGETGAFGPGFGIGLALLAALLVLVTVALTRRRR